MRFLIHAATVLTATVVFTGCADLDFSAFEDADFNQPLIFSELDGAQLDDAVKGNDVRGTLVLDNEELPLDDRSFTSELTCETEVVNLRTIDADGHALVLSFQQLDDAAGALIHLERTEGNGLWAFDAGTVAMEVAEDCTWAAGTFDVDHDGQRIQGTFSVGF